MKFPGEKWPPLWMPEGSLRGIALLITVVTLNVMWFMGKTISQDQILIATGIIGGYFSIRTLVETKKK